VCPYGRLCEEACSRCGIDRPIEIGKLQRYAIEQEELFGMVERTAAPAPGGGAAKVACVGAGPASIACAAVLARAGVDVTVYEREDKPGGVLTYGIAPVRLPQKVVDHDIDAVRALGVKFECGVSVGEDISADDLTGKKGFDAVFIGTGLWAPKIPDIPGGDSENVLSAVDFLKQARKNGGFAKLDGRDAVIIGGGDVAMDCAVTAQLSGAANVAIWYRRTIAEAPASMDEIRTVTELGVGICENFAPSSIEKSGERLLARFKGRDGISEATVACDFVVFAVGQGAEDMQKYFGVSTGDKGLIKADPATDRAGIFAAGDIVNGGKTVVESVAGGKEAADAILAYLDKKGVGA
jgi:dihydropyrimidine dehydrogenase (NAD+) subunit PreT